MSSMAQNIFPSAGRKYAAHVSRGASENSLFPPKRIDLTVSIYGTSLKLPIIPDGVVILF